jgi:predicted porin
MKKSLLAVAAMTAFAGAAQAQSSVTVYGIMDMGYIGGNSRIQNNAAGNTAPTAGTNLTTNTQTSSIGSAAESTSRLGFKGNEDLGGGLSAFFTVEIGLQPSSTSTLDSGTTQNRQTFVGLKKNGIGQFALGTQYTTIHNAVAVTDPGMQNNMAGNLIYDKATGLTSVTQTNASGAAAVVGNQQFAGQGNNTSYTVRESNMLTASTDTFAGFQANAFFQAGNGTTNNNTTNQTAAAANGYAGGKTQSNGFGLGLNYTWQKLFLTANYQGFSQVSPYSVVNNNGAYAATGAPAMNGAGGAALLGTNVLDNQHYYAATYDFGILKAYAQYIGRKTTDTHNMNNGISRTAQQIGVRSFITPTIESWASAGTGKMQYTTAGNTTLVSGMTTTSNASSSFGGFQLGSNYWLSKRTNLYAIYGQQRTNNAQYGSALNGPTAYNQNDYAVGVRHTF